MNAILLFSHGSVLCGAGENLKALAARLQAQSDPARGDAEIVEVGYLNYSEPFFESAFEKCVQRGATQITVAPYFLVEGKFVKVDLPPHIEAMKARFPEVRVLVAEAMRFHPTLAQALLNCAERAISPSQWRDHLKTAPQFCRASEECPLFGTPRCPTTSAANLVENNA